MGKKVAGTCYVTAGGTQFDLSGTVTVSPEDNEKEGLVGPSGVAGYKESPRVPFIEIEAFTSNGLDVKAIAEDDDMTVTAELANGQVWALRNAWKAGATDMNVVDGTAPLRFEGMKCERVK